jgi:hypothetical protein
MPETTQQYHRVPSARKKKGNELRTISLGKGIKALYDPKRKMVVTYLFDKTKYTMKQAKDWVKNRKKSDAHLQEVENRFLAKKIAELYRDTKKETLEVLTN